MASETHVWLLHAGRSSGPAGAGEGLVRTAWLDEAWSPGLSGLWRRLWAWWEGRSTKALPPPPTQPALTGPTAAAPPDPAREELRLVDELQRHLGPGYLVRSVPRWPEGSVEKAARSLSMGVRVVLLPLRTLPDGAPAQALIRGARGAMDPGRKVAQAPCLAAQDGAVEVLAAGLREGLIALGAAGPVPVLFAAGALSAPGSDHAAQAERLAQAVAREARLAGPAEVAFYGHAAPWGGPQPRVSAVLKAWASEGRGQALLVPLDTLVPGPLDTGRLEALARSAPLGVGLAVLPGARPLFVRALAAACRSAEVRAGWREG